MSVPSTFTLLHWYGHLLKERDRKILSALVGTLEGPPAEKGIAGVARKFKMTRSRTRRIVDLAEKRLVDFWNADLWHSDREIDLSRADHGESTM